MERLPPAAGVSILTCTYQWTLRMIWLFASHRETQKMGEEYETFGDKTISERSNHD